MEADALPVAPGKLSLLQARSPVTRRSYGPPMAASAMAKFLAQAAKQLREDADRRRFEIASSASDRVDPSTIYRFEKGRWPEDADRLIDLYAAELALDPIEVWSRALDLWRAAGETDALSEPGGPSDRPAQVAADVADRLRAAAGSPPPQAHDAPRTRPATKRRKPA